jgi:D-alanyl-D-alanine dipeptidase
LRPEAAKKLLQAQKLLKKEHPGKSLLIYDAARPMAVQRRMWSLVQGTGKTYYVANPAKGGGLHNYGMAVDITILDEKGQPLPMGTPFDYFGKEANTDREEELVQAKKITPEEYANRRLLRRIMKQAGFTTVTSEWWHFNACSRSFARQNLPLID